MQVKPAPGAALYETLAQIYDRTGQSRFSLKMVSYLLELLALRRLKPRKVIDLACGTGAAAVALARRRFEVTGVDGSGAMLARAKARADRWKVAVEWHQQDLTGLTLPGGYDLATCFYDSLNHLTDPEQLRQALFGVRRLLAPGGHFFFDMNTVHGLSTGWGQAVDTHVDDDYVRIWRTRYAHDSGLATLDATYFLAAEGGLFKRVDVQHVARGYAPETITSLLTEAGFEVLAAYDCLTFDPASPHSYRVAYLARA